MFARLTRFNTPIPGDKDQRNSAHANEVANLKYYGSALETSPGLSNAVRFGSKPRPTAGSGLIVLSDRVTNLNAQELRLRIN